MNLTLLALWLIWAALLFGGYLLGGRAGGGGRSGERRMPTWTRMLSSLVLAIAGWALFATARNTPAAGFGLLIAVGMTLGLLGDLFMARVIPLGNHVLAGMAAFALGHVAYIAAGLRYGNAMGASSAGLRVAAWLVWLLIGALGWWFLVYRGQRASTLHWAALPYALLLASTAGIATGLALQDPRFIPFALGAVLFLFSDLLIAAGMFSHRTLGRVNLDDVVWLTYGPGQMLIVATVYVVLRSAAS